MKIGDKVRIIIHDHENNSLIKGPKNYGDEFIIAGIAFDRDGYTKIQCTEDLEEIKKGNKYPDYGFPLSSVILVDSIIYEIY